MLDQRIDDGSRLGEGGDGAAHAVVAQLAEYCAGAERLLDQLELVGIEQVCDKAGVLVHDVRPELHDLEPLEVGLAARQVVEAPLPALSLVAGVIEEQWPHQAAQLTGCLRLAETSLVFDEGFDSLGQGAMKVFTSERSGGVSATMRL